MMHLHLHARGLPPGNHLYTLLFCNAFCYKMCHLTWLNILMWKWFLISMVSCQKGPTRHAHAWQIGPFWQDTLDIMLCLRYMWVDKKRTIGRAYCHWFMWVSGDFSGSCLICVLNYLTLRNVGIILTTWPTTNITNISNEGKYFSSC